VISMAAPTRISGTVSNLDPGLSTPYLPVHAGFALDERFPFGHFQLRDDRGQQSLDPVPSDRFQVRKLAHQSIRRTCAGLYPCHPGLTARFFTSALPDATSYSMQSGGNIWPGTARGRSDWKSPVPRRGVNEQPEAGGGRSGFELYYSFQCINRVSERRSPDGKPRVITTADGPGLVPWDWDMMLVPRSHQPGTLTPFRCLNVPVLRGTSRSAGKSSTFPVPTRADCRTVGNSSRNFPHAMPAGFHETTGATRRGGLELAFAPESETFSTLTQPAAVNFAAVAATRATPDLDGFRLHHRVLNDSRPVEKLPPTTVTSAATDVGYLQQSERCRIRRHPPCYSAPRDFPRTSLVRSDCLRVTATNRFAAVKWRVGEISARAERLRRSTGLRYEIEDALVSDELGLRTCRASAKTCLRTHLYRVRAPL